MKKTLSTFALGLALTFGAAALAPAANAAPAPAPVKAPIAKTQPTIATPMTKAQFSTAIAKLKTGNAAATKTYNAAVAAEKSAYEARVGVLEKRFVPIKAQLDANRAAMEKAVAAEEAGYKLVVARFQAKFPAKVKAIAAEQAGLRSRNIENANASEKINEDWAAVYESLAQRADAARGEYNKAAASNKAAAKTALDAALVKVNAERSAAGSDFTKKGMALWAAREKDSKDTALRIAAIDKEFAAAAVKKDSKIAALHDEYSKATHAVEVKFFTDFYNTYLAMEKRLQKLSNDFSTAQKKYAADLAKLQAGYAAAKA